MKEQYNEMLQRITRVEERLKSTQERLEKAEDHMKWLWRTFAGVIIAAIVAFIVSGGLN